MDRKPTKNNQSLEKALNIIELLAESGKPLRLQDIANMLEYPASTTLRFLKTLEKYKYIKQIRDSHKYSLTFKICRLGSLVSSQYNIRDIVKPYLVELAKKVGESTCLAIEEDHKAVYIDVESGPDNILRVMQRIGKEAPLYCTGVGKILLLNYDPLSRSHLFSNYRLEKLTRNTISSLDLLEEELERVSRQQFAIDDEECEMGARCIAAPIRDYTTRIIASISVSGPTSRMSFQKIDYIKMQIAEVAYNISAELGFESSDTETAKM